MTDPVGSECPPRRNGAAGHELERPSPRRSPRLVRAAVREGERPALHDHLVRGTPTVRIARRDRWPVAWAGLIAVFLVGALLKPWEGPSLAASSSEPAAPATSAAGPSAGPEVLADLRAHCQDPLGWRVYSRELGIGRQVRTWSSVEPVKRATGPADPAIPVVLLGPVVDALGYCSPWTGSERPPADARPSAWRRDAAGGGAGLTAIRLRTIAPDHPSILGALFGPLAGQGPGASLAPGPGASDPRSAAGSDAAPAPTRWPAGRYVFALRAAGWERWWAVQVARPDREAPMDAEPGPGPDGTPASDAAASPAIGSAGP